MRGDGGGGGGGGDGARCDGDDGDGAHGSATVLVTGQLQRAVVYTLEESPLPRQQGAALGLNRIEAWIVLLLVLGFGCYMMVHDATGTPTLWTLHFGPCTLQSARVQIVEYCS